MVSSSQYELNDVYVHTINSDIKRPSTRKQTQIMNKLPLTHMLTS